MSIATTKKVTKRRRPAVLAAVRARIASVPPAPAYFRWRSPVERAVAVLLLGLALPMIGVLVLLVRLSSRGPGIYRQSRVGRRGTRFMMYKIRTMRQDAEVASGPTWTQARDPRVTPLGRVLRRMHLDELPQLLNVVKGEMSLVGPRPERPEFVHVLTDAVPGYLDRLAVLPGVTGLAQLNLPPDTDLASVRRKLVLDCEYIKTAGPLLDLRLLACTFLRMFKLPERWAIAMFGLHRTVTLPAVADTAAGANGNGHSSTTPMGIRIQAAVAANKDDGSPPARPTPSGKHSHHKTTTPKPR